MHVLPQRLSKNSAKARAVGSGSAIYVHTGRNRLSKMSRTRTTPCGSCAGGVGVRDYSRRNCKSKTSEFGTRVGNMHAVPSGNNNSLPAPFNTKAGAWTFFLQTGGAV